MAKGPLRVLGRPLAESECQLVYTFHVPRDDVGQLISNIDPDYPNAGYTAENSDYLGEPTTFVRIETGRNRLNVQSEVLQFQPTAEVDVEYLWPKETKLTVDYHINAPVASVRPLTENKRLYWGIELEEPITESEFSEYQSEVDHLPGAVGELRLSNSGQVMFMQLKGEISVRGTKTGLFRMRSFTYDVLLAPDTPDLPLRQGRSSDIITCTQPR